MRVGTLQMLVVKILVGYFIVIDLADLVLIRRVLEYAVLVVIHLNLFGVTQKNVHLDQPTASI